MSLSSLSLKALVLRFLHVSIRLRMTSLKMMLMLIKRLVIMQATTDHPTYSLKFKPVAVTILSVTKSVKIKKWYALSTIKTSLQISCEFRFSLK